MSGLVRLPLTFVIFRLAAPANPTWMPSLWADTECKEAELSKAFWAAARSFDEELRKLGFTACGFMRVGKHLSPAFLDSGGINYLDQTSCYFGQLIYAKVGASNPAVPPVENVTIAFTAVFEHDSLSYTNGKLTFDPLPEQKVTRISSSEPARLYQMLLQAAGQHGGSPRPFSEQNSLRAWFDERQIKTFQQRVNRGLFVRMADYEAPKET
jgi:hypothetical protein